MVLTVEYSSTELYCSPELQNYILLIRPPEQRLVQHTVYWSLDCTVTS